MGLGALAALAFAALHSTPNDAAAAKVLPLAKDSAAVLATAKKADKTAAQALSIAREEKAPGDPGDSGAPGPTGPQGAKGDTGQPGDAGASMYDGPLPTGMTMTGTWGMTFHRPTLANANIAIVGFPVRAPSPVGNDDVGFGAQPAGQPALTADVLANRCRGSVDDPQALPGAVCLYLNSSRTLNVGGLTGQALKGTDGVDPLNTFGFQVFIAPAASPGTPVTTVRAEGVWAYTAP
jgi:hypothetical protein